MNTAEIFQPHFRFVTPFTKMPQGNWMNTSNTPDFK